MASDEGKRGKGRRSDIPWAEIRAAYAAGDTNLSELGRRFGVKRHSIGKRMRAEKWPTKAQVATDAGRKVIDMATRQAIKELGGEQKLADEAVSQIKDALQRHFGIETLLLDVATATLKRLKDQMVASVGQPLRAGKATSEADEIKSAIGAALSAIDGSRLVHGLRPGQASVGDSDDEKRVDQAILIVREPAKSA